MTLDARDFAQENGYKKEKKDKEQKHAYIRRYPYIINLNLEPRDLLGLCNFIPEDICGLANKP